MPEDVLSRYMARTLSPAQRVEHFVDVEPRLAWIRALQNDLPEADITLAGETLRDVLLGRFPTHFAVAINNVTPRDLRAWLALRGDLNAFGDTLAFRPRPLVTDVYIAPEPQHRTDFTFDHTRYHVGTQSFTDPHNGLEDLAKKTLRVPSYPLRHFADDPLRTLRAMRLAASHNLAFDPETWHALVCTLPRLQKTTRNAEGSVEYIIPRAHVGSTLLETLAHNPRYGHALLHASGALDLLFARHDDDRAALEASKNLLDQLHALHASRTTGLPRLDTNLLLAAILTHVEDAPTHAHDRIRALHLHTLPADHPGRIEPNDIQWLLENADMFSTVDPAGMTPSAFEKIFTTPRGRALLALMQAKYLTTGLAQGASGADSHHHLTRERVHTARRLLDAIDRHRQHLPKLIRGRDLEVLGVPPGPHYRQLLAKIRDAQLTGTVTNRQEALELIQKTLA